MPPSLDRLSHFPCFRALHSQSSMFSSLLRIPIPGSVSNLIADNLTVNGSFNCTFIRVQCVIICHFLFLGVCCLVDSFRFNVILGMMNFVLNSTLYGKVQIELEILLSFKLHGQEDKGKTTSGKALHYKGTPFHRIVSSFVIQGGDILYGDRKGYESIYGGTFDENFRIKHSHAGVVSMVNSGPDSNGSQFFITTIKSSCPPLMFWILLFWRLLYCNQHIVVLSLCCNFFVCCLCLILEKCLQWKTKRLTDLRTDGLTDLTYFYVISISSLVGRSEGCNLCFEDSRIYFCRYCHFQTGYRYCYQFNWS
uniref:peptidylprolyl isomerase n=1 Tax=Cucumis melo TaxID=3656 RepID=A0A9I9E5R9_CUCME